MTFIDGTHTFSKFKTILLIVVAIDANGYTFPLAYAVVPIEDERWWTWFLDVLTVAYPRIKQSEEHIFMSDRQKGLVNAVATSFALSKPAFCCNHICENLTVKFGKDLKKQFWKIAYALTQDKFKKALQELRAINSPAAEYLDQIPHDLWTTCAFPLP
jgi:transposase-like protein